MATAKDQYFADCRVCNKTVQMGIDQFNRYRHGWTVCDRCEETRPTSSAPVVLFGAHASTNYSQGTQRRLALDGQPYTYSEFLQYYGDTGADQWASAPPHSNTTRPSHTGWGNIDNAPSVPEPFSRPRAEGEDSPETKRHKGWGQSIHKPAAKTRCSNSKPCLLGRCSKNRPCKGNPHTPAKARDPNDPTCTKKNPCRLGEVMTKNGNIVTCSGNYPCFETRPDSEEEATHQESDSESDDYCGAVNPYEGAY